MCGNFVLDPINGHDNHAVFVTFEVGTAFHPEVEGQRTAACIIHIEVDGVTTGQVGFVMAVNATQRDTEVTVTGRPAFIILVI